MPSSQATCRHCKFTHWPLLPASPGPPSTMITGPLPPLMLLLPPAPGVPALELPPDSVLGEPPLAPPVLQLNPSSMSAPPTCSRALNRSGFRDRGSKRLLIAADRGTAEHAGDGRERSK